MNAKMKTTLISTALAFSAGAACAASITAFSYRDRLSPEDFLARADVLLVEIADLGSHVAGTRDGQTFLRSAPPIACIPPPNPKMPEGTVPIGALNAGMDALLAVNQGGLDGENNLVQWIEKCHIVGD